MDLQKLIKHHRREAEHSRRLGAHVAADFHTGALAFLEGVAHMETARLIMQDDRRILAALDDKPKP
jgi:hypothetical protein